MRFFEGAASLPQDVNGAAGRAGAGERHHVVQVEAVEVIHGMVEPAVFGAAEFLDGDGVGVGTPRGPDIRWARALGPFHFAE